MKYGYLTPEERAANAEEFAKIKELVIKWLKKVPADKFDNERIEAVLFCNDEPSWRYKERCWKTCYLRAIRETTHIYELVKLLYKLPQYGEDLLALFLFTDAIDPVWGSEKTYQAGWEAGYQVGNERGFSTGYHEALSNATEGFWGPFS